MPSSITPRSKLALIARGTCLWTACGKCRDRKAFEWWWSKVERCTCGHSLSRMSWKSGPDSRYWSKVRPTILIRNDESIGEKPYRGGTRFVRHWRRHKLGPLLAGQQHHLIHMNHYSTIRTGTPITIQKSANLRKENKTRDNCQALVNLLIKLQTWPK